MARVTGPLHSDTASGTFAKSLTFSGWKGRPYVRERVIPANPKAPKQVGVRSMMAFLATQWAIILATAGTTWHAAAMAKSISDFNEYVSANLKRWQNWQGPTIASPAAGTSAGQTITTQTLTGGVGQTNIALAWTTNAADWGIAILRSAAAITAPDWTQVIAVVPPTSAGVLTYIDTPLAAGTWHYRTAILNKDGVMGTVHADGTATVT